MTIRLLILGTLFVFAGGCTGGLDPEAIPGEAKIFGTVTYTGDLHRWPPPDSIVDLRVVAFQEVPEKITDIAEALANGRLFFSSQTLDRNVSSSGYLLTIPNAPVTLRYIALVQLYSTNLSRDWRFLGVYTAGGSSHGPSVLQVKPGATYSGIDITVDFSKLPPQPSK